MLRIPILLAFLFSFAVAVEADAQSEPSPQQPQSQSKSGKLGTNNSPAQPNPTANFPTPQEVTEAIANGIERAAEKHEATNPSLPPDNGAWYFNFFLVVFTGLLVVVGGGQCYLIFWTLKATEKAANAAMLRATASIALQLPFIQIEPDILRHGDDLTDGEITYFCFVHFLTFVNLGSTKTFPKEIRYGWTIGEEELPAEPRYLRSETFSPNLIFEPNPKLRQQKHLEFKMPLEPGGWSLVCGGEVNLWFYCTFAYEDFMRNDHNEGFCWRWQNVGIGMGWRVDDTPAYNKKIHKYAGLSKPP